MLMARKATASGASAKASKTSRNAGQAEASTAAAPSPVSLDDLLLSLDRHIKLNDYKQVVKIADEILAMAPGDTDASVCKLVALIQDDNIDQALSVIHSATGSPLDLRYHKAYCLYRKNSLQEALEALKGLERDAAVLQLEAQILYRKGEMDPCIRSYQALFQKHKVDSIELKTNIVAAYVSGGISDHVPSLLENMKITPSSSFELAYNFACALLERRDYQKAEELLLLARRIGQEMLIEEEYTEEEAENELAPISVQLAYVHQVQGHKTEAMERYNKLVKQKLPDAASMAVASNNLVALRGAKDSIKKLDKLIEISSDHRLKFVEGLEHKLSSRQKEAIGVNCCLLLLHSNKSDRAQELISLLKERFSDSVMPIVLNAVLLVKEGKLSHAEELLGQYAEKHPMNSTVALLARAQIAVLAGHHLIAAESLEHITELQHRLGMVATVVALKEKGGDLQGAEATLHTALQWWENHMGEDGHTLELIMQEAAAFKLRHKQLDGAAQIFQKLALSSSADVRAQALIGLVRSMTHTDLAKAESYESQLPALSGLTSIDPNVLEHSIANIVSSTGGEKLEKDQIIPSEGGDKTASKNKRKRKRKPRYPKGFDPANPGPPPDPERWLPKRERSSYRPKRKDKRAAHVRGSQGSVAKERASDSLATSNGPATSGALRSSGSTGGKAAGSTTEASKSTNSNTRQSKKKSRR